MKKLYLLTLAAVAFLATPVATFAQFALEGVWTSVCSVGAVDEADQGLYQVTGAQLFFGASKVGSIIARYNIVNTSNSSGTQQPAWNTFELGYTDTGAGSITAFLYEVDPCTGAQETICTFTPPNSAAGGSCATCQFPNNTFDFESNLYFIALVLNRTSSTASDVRANTLRLYALP